MQLISLLQCQNYKYPTLLRRALRHFPWFRLKLILSLREVIGRWRIRKVKFLRKQDLGKLQDTVLIQKFANFSRFPRVPHQTCFYPHFQITMSCWPLTEISANSNQRGGIEGRFELTSNWHSHIVDHACDDQSLKTITEDLQIPLSTIYCTVSHNKTCFNNESLHWCDHSNIISDSLCHWILHEVHINLKIWYRDLWLNLGLHEKTLFKFFLYHVLKNEDITNWLTKKRPALTSEVTAKHLWFTKDHEY